jgi:hypothetical protein
MIAGANEIQAIRFDLKGVTGAGCCQVERDRRAWWGLNVSLSMGDGLCQSMSTSATNRDIALKNGDPFKMSR